ncbi:MAG: DUF4249 family protein [Ignavibacteriales bacterium]|nr:MAG: DUF4249 family protein [Ignavibacteriales bacterium]
MMKKRIIKYFLLLLPFAFFSCEEEAVIENTLPYEEYVVVRAKLEGNEIFEGVSFTKTLPHDEQYDISKAELNDVFAYMIIDGVRVIPLKYTANGIYKPVENLVIETGKTYELYAKWNGKQIYAKSYVPQEPDVLNARINGSYLNGEITITNKEVAGATWLIAYSATSVTDEAEEFYEVKTSASEDQQNISVRTTDLPDKYRTLQYRNRYYVRFYCFDKQYADYFKTKDGNKPIENIFAQGASTIVWNVQGEKTIGLFIGMTKSKLIKAE